MGEIIPFPLWMIPLVTNAKCFIKEVFGFQALKWENNWRGKVNKAPMRYFFSVKQWTTETNSTYTSTPFHVGHAFLHVCLREVIFIISLEVGQIIPFPVWIIPFPVWIIQFPVLKINFESIVTNDKCFIKEVFASKAWPAGSQTNNSISCIENQFWTCRNKQKIFHKEILYHRPGSRTNNSISCVEK